MQVAAVILAAGASTRFGSRKQLVRLGGRTMLEVVIRLARVAGLDPVIAVIPPGVAVPPDAVPEINGDPAAGISRSLRLGLAAVPGEVGAAVVLLGDEPTLAVESIRAIVEAANGGGAIVAARSGDRIGPPVFMRRESFDLALAAVGDEGLGRLLRERADLTTVDVTQPQDIDTPEDLARIAHMFDSSPDA